MIFTITPVNDFAEVTPEWVRDNNPLQEIDRLAAFFDALPLGDRPTLTLGKAKLHTQEVENYVAIIVSTYTIGKDRWVNTADGGQLNIGKLIRDMRKAIKAVS